MEEEQQKLNQLLSFIGAYFQDLGDHVCRRKDYDISFCFYEWSRFELLYDWNLNQSCFFSLDRRLQQREHQGFVPCPHEKRVAITGYYIIINNSFFYYVYSSLYLYSLQYYLTFKSFQVFFTTSKFQTKTIIKNRRYSSEPPTSRQSRQGTRLICKLKQNNAFNIYHAFIQFNSHHNSESWWDMYSLLRPNTYNEWWICKDNMATRKSR